MRSFVFPVEYERFHRKQLFNYQLNRWYSMGYARREDMEAAGKRVRGFSDWKREMLALAEASLSEGRLMNAAFYFRAAEFYTRARDPDKETLYRRFVDLFYEVFDGEGIERHAVPYQGSLLPALRLRPETGSKGTIVLHGGFESFIEEFYSMMCFFCRRGYEVIGFEGPGQGAALRAHGLPLAYEWERPVKAVLDHFRVEDCTLIGISMGGWFCLRAAAFEPRIRRVIATGHAIDYMKCMPPAFRAVHLWFLKHCRGFMNRMAVMKFEKREGMAPWVVDHMKYITKKERPIDALETYVLMNEESIHCERVTQDVLILSGEEDHFIPGKMHAMQLAALPNARSATGRVFRRTEQAGNHCQIGNLGLALEVMAGWIEKTTEEARASSDG